MKNAPTIEQLAHVAASLAARSNAGDFKSLARRALELWTACNTELEREARVGILVGELTEELGRIEDSIPQPPKGFPASLRDFMKVFVHRGDETKNLPVFKAFITEWLHREKAFKENTSLENTSPPADVETENVLVRLRATGFDEDTWVVYARQYESFSRRKRSEHARVAAQAPRRARKSRKKDS